MVYKKCPGQDPRQKKMEDIVCNLPCPQCGSDVEIFYDEKNRICPECSARVSKTDAQLLKDFGCADWCEAAEKCIGPDLYKRLIHTKNKK
jgi:hypothetical protein